MSIAPGPIALDAAIHDADALLTEATERSLRMVSIGMGL